MHSIQIADKKYTGASQWSEVNTRALLFIAVLYPFIINSERAKDLLIRKLFKVPNAAYKELLDWQKPQLYTLLTWIFTKNTLQNWLLPVVKNGKTTWFGPKNKLSNLTGEQFMWAEAAYERWLYTHNEAHLTTLFAVLYRKKPFFAFRSPVFDPDKLPKLEKQLSGLKLHIKRAVALNYSGIRNLMIDRHPHVWRKAQDQDNNRSLKAKPEYQTPWAKIFLNLAGDKFGPYPYTLSTNVWLLLADLEEKAKQVAELEARGK